MLFQKKFFKRSKKFSPQNVDVLACNKGGKKKGMEKSSKQPSLLQKLKFIDNKGLRDNNNTSAQQNIVAKEIIKYDQPSKQAQASALLKVKMQCKSEWNLNMPTSGNVKRTERSNRLFSKSRNIQGSFSRNMPLYDHPAFRSSLYRGSLYLNKSASKSKSYSKFFVQNLQSIEEELEEDL